MKRLLLSLTGLLLFLSSCSFSASTQDWYAYFPAKSYMDGSAITGQPLAIRDREPSVDELINALLDGPTDPNLYSPFPAGVSLRSWTLEDGLLDLVLTEQYGGLSGIQLTLADYSFALTLCQLEDVDGVTITVINDPMAFRHHQVLTPEDILLTDMLSGNT